MGRSATYTFSVHAQAGTVEHITGAMSIKQAKNNLLSQIEYAKEHGGTIPDKAYLWAQTAAGRKLLKGFDYIELMPDGTINRKNIQTN